MRPRGFLSFALAFLAATSVLAQGSKAAKPKAAAGSSSSTPVFMPASDLKWTPMDPNVPGIMFAKVSGDYTKGAWSGFIKFPAGFMSPLHTHTSAIKFVVISGTYLQTPEGLAEVRLGPGSYEYQPGGSYKHVTGCDKASDCVIFAQSTGKFDLKPVEAAK